MFEEFYLETDLNHLTIFPTELLQMEAYRKSKVCLNGTTYNIQVEKTEGIEDLPIARTVRVSDCMDKLILERNIWISSSYTLRQRVLDPEPVILSQDTLPRNIGNKAGWALGFIRKNQTNQANLRTIYNQYYSEYKRYILNTNRDAKQYRPVCHCFTPWLTAVYRADEQGSFQNATVKWALSGFPTKQEVFDFLQSMIPKCATEHNRNRIRYVIEQL